MITNNIDLTNDTYESRACTNLFYLYTNTKYNVGDTIIIGDTIHKAR